MKTTDQWSRRPGQLTYSSERRDFCVWIAEASLLVNEYLCTTRLGEFFVVVTRGPCSWQRHGRRTRSQTQQVERQLALWIFFFSLRLTMGQFAGTWLCALVGDLRLAPNRGRLKLATPLISLWLYSRSDCTRLFIHSPASCQTLVVQDRSCR